MITHKLVKVDNGYSWLVFSNDVVVDSGHSKSRKRAEKDLNKAFRAQVKIERENRVLTVHYKYKYNNENFRYPHNVKCFEGETFIEGCKCDEREFSHEVGREMVRRRINNIRSGAA